MSAITDTFSLGTFPVGLAGAALVMLTGVVLAMVWGNRHRVSGQDRLDEQRAAQPVPIEETERYIVGRDERTAEDDVAERRRRQLAEAARDP